MTGATSPDGHVAGSLPTRSGVAWDRAAEDYATHRAAFPPLLADLLAPLGVGGPGQHVVDLGSGIGTPAVELAAAGATVTAVDPAAAMLERARSRAAAAGVELTTVVGTAEATGLPDGCADAVTAGQSWHWFDPAAAATEVARLLRPGGRVALCQQDWQPDLDPSGRTEATLTVLRRHAVVRPEAIDDVDPRRSTWSRQLRTVGLVEVAWLDLVISHTYTPEAWRGRLRASTWGHGSLDAEAVRALDADLAEVLADAPAEFDVPHSLRVLVARRARTTRRRPVGRGRDDARA